jgi:tRNA (cmo5U34)-methyltransferase
MGPKRLIAHTIGKPMVCVPVRIQEVVPVTIIAGSDAAANGVGQQDNGYTPERWAFDDEVTRVFDDMLERSIPQYQRMREAVFEVGRRFVRPGTAIVDLGCSRGEALAPFVAVFGPQNANTFVGCEVSDPMLAAARERFRDRGDVSIVKHDLRDGPPPIEQASLTLAVLTLQFTPINYRQQIVQGVYQRTTDRGAFIVVEKVLGSGSALDELMVDLYHTAKRQAGYSLDEIERKRLALEGVLVPITAEWNAQLLLQAGFREVDCFWRWMNFAAWIAIK